MTHLFFLLRKLSFLRFSNLELSWTISPVQIVVVTTMYSLIESSLVVSVCWGFLSGLLMFYHHLPCLLIIQFYCLKCHLLSLFQLLLMSFLCFVSFHKVLFTLDIGWLLVLNSIHYPLFLFNSSLQPIWFNF